MTTLRAMLAILALMLVAAPATAQDEVPLLEPCADVAGATRVSPAEAFSGVVETPIGAIGSTQAEAGVYLVDLAGLPEGTRRNVTLTLTFDNPFADYDMVIDGNNELSTDSPEVFTVSNANHCKRISVQTEVFIGLPIDELNLSVAPAKK
jgi:hypothetical protein